MADDEYVAVVNLGTATHALAAMVETRRGYLKLIENMIAPFPLEHKFDQTKRNQMITLLCRADTLWVLALVQSESTFVGKSTASKAKIARRNMLGEHLTRASIARGLAIAERGDRTAEAARRHTVAASRIVEAGLAFGLFQRGAKPDDKQEPVVGTARLSKFLHALGDHAYWVMKNAVDNSDDVDTDKFFGVGETSAHFDREASFSTSASYLELTSEDHVVRWLKEGGE